MGEVLKYLPSRSMLNSLWSRRKWKALDFQLLVMNTEELEGGLMSVIMQFSAYTNAVETL